MRAVLCRRPAGASAVRFEDVQIAPPDAPRDRDLLIRVKATSSNPLDAKRAAARPDPDPHGVILGWSAVGMVEAVGANVHGFSPGELVWYAGAPDRPGCFAEIQLMDERLVGHAPTQLSAEEAAAMPLAALTAAEALFDHLRVDEHDTPHVLCVNGGGGAVASMAVQLARLNPAIEIIATAGSDRSRQWLEQIGAHHVIDHRRCLWRQAQQLPCSRPASVFSMFTNDRSWESYIVMLEPFGHICVADHSARLDIPAAREKSIAFHWQAMFTRPRHLSEASGRQGEHLTRIAQLLDSGVLTPLPHQPPVMMHAASIAAALANSGGGPRPVFSVNKRTDR